MTARWRRGIAAGIAVYACAAALAGAALDGFSITTLLSNSFFAGLALVGAVILFRDPANVIGWTLALTGLFEPSAVVGARYAEYALDRGGAPFAGEAAYVSSWIWAPSMYLFVRLFLRFPTGRLMSPVWRYVEAGAAAGAATVVVAVAVQFWHRREPALVLQESNGDGALAVAATAGFFVIFASFLVAVPGMLLRFRRARGIERQQLKWFALSAVLVGASGVLDVVVLDRLGAPQAVGDVISVFAFNSIPVAVAIAILRYRLYDIDVIVNRTLVYTTLTAVLIAFYAAAVLVFRAVLDPVTGDNDVAIAASTLAVASVFGPLRTRTQHFIDRRFYRSRYDAQQTLEMFAARLRDQVDLDALSRELTRVVSDTVQPRHASVWLVRDGAT
jgi:hypothetical protein